MIALGESHVRLQFARNLILVRRIVLLDQRDRILQMSRWDRTAVGVQFECGSEVVERIGSFVGRARCQPFEFGQIEMGRGIVGPLLRGALEVPHRHGKEIEVHRQNAVVALDGRGH